MKTVMEVLAVYHTAEQTWNKSQVCKDCLRIIFEKIADIFPAVFYPSKPTSLHCYPQLNHLC